MTELEIEELRARAFDLALEVSAMRSEAERWRRWHYGELLRRIVAEETVVRANVRLQLVNEEPETIRGVTDIEVARVMEMARAG